MKIKPDISWRYWLLMDILLVVGLAGYERAFVAAIGLGAVQSLHFLVRHRSLTAFPVQVRVSYLGLLLLGLWPPLYFIYWIQLAGTTAMVMVDYCPLARFLSLMPWNRERPFNWALVWQTMIAPPVKGNILQGLPAD